jgi:hypothetical protein
MTRQQWRKLNRWRRATEKLLAAHPELATLIRSELINPPPVHGRCLMTDYLKQWEAEEIERRGWAGDYDGTDCPNCGRARMLLCVNSKRCCEKCNWDPDTKNYSERPYT